MTNEHIIPVWLLTELGLMGKQMAGVHSSFFGFIKSSRKHPFNSFVNGLICKKCNAGWMSELESAVRPVLTSLMSLKADFYKDLPSCYEFIAKWAFKTALVLNYGTNYRRLVPLDHFHSFYKFGIPKGVYINLGLAGELQDHIWEQTQTLFVHGEKNRAEKCINTNVHYKITFQFRYLLLRICYFPFDDFILDPKTETSISLWPHFGKYEEFKSYQNLHDFASKCVFAQTYR